MDSGGACTTVARGSAVVLLALALQELVDRFFKVSVARLSCHKSKVLQVGLGPIVKLCPDVVRNAVVDVGVGLLTLVPESPQF